MKDERMQPLLDAWFHDRDEAARDASGDIARVMADVPRTRQQGRWWPFPSFDRPVSTFPSQELALVPIPPTNGRQPAKGFTMFSALKFIAAAAIVALFGGFLLAGVVTTPQGDEMAPAAVTESPSSMTTEALLSGMVTEEVEPGVFRVLDDGAGHTFPLVGVDHPRDVDGLYAAPDGAVWVRLSPCCSDNEVEGVPDQILLRLVTPGNHVASPDGYPGGLSLATGLDGTLWAGGYSEVAAWDGETWAKHDPRPGDDHGGPDPGVWIEVLPDGSVWTTYHEGSAWLGPDGWEAFSTADGAPGWLADIVLAPSGDIYSVGGPLNGSPDGGQLVRLEDGKWQEVPLPVTDEAARVTGIRQAPDGSLWVHFISRAFPSGVPRDLEDWWGDGTHPHDHLARLDGETWTVHLTPDLLPVFTSSFSVLGSEWDIHPDGSLWFMAAPDEGHSQSLRSFDGETWTIQLEGVDWFHIGPDGTVWTSGECGGELSAYDGSTWRTYSSVPGPCSPEFDFDTAPDGSAWINARGKKWRTRASTSSPPRPWRPRSSSGAGVSRGMDPHPPPPGQRRGCKGAEGTRTWIPTLAPRAWRARGGADHRCEHDLCNTAHMS